jgi:hypothetical protein
MGSIIRIEEMSEKRSGHQRKALRQKVEGKGIVLLNAVARCVHETCSLGQLLFAELASPAADRD